VFIVHPLENPHFPDRCLMAKRPNPILRVLSFLAALALFGGVCAGAFALLDYHWAWQPILNYRQLFWEGWLATLAISGVPFFIVDRAWAVSGAQPASAWVEALRQAAARPPAGDAAA